MAHRTTKLALLALLAWACSAGCAPFRVPTIDPTGRRIFLPPAAAVAPPVVPGLALQQPCLSISPGQVVAPIGSEVVMTSGITLPDGTLATREQIEWMLSPTSVGQFVAMNEPDGLCQIFQLRSRPQKLTNQYAVGTTTGSLVNLTRGNFDPADDVTIQPGQAWITVTSNAEGSSEVTAFAPTVTGWDCRKATGVIHWVDVQWVFPQSAINAMGDRHVFTTQLSRQSDGSPLAGYRVQYQIVDGPASAFAPDGSDIADVPTDPAGQASVEIFQPTPEGGTNRIAISIIRPAVEGPNRVPELILGTGFVTKTWTAPQLTVDLSGPVQASVGATATYELVVANGGDLAASGVSASIQLPPGVTFVESAPPAQVQGGAIAWHLGELFARQQQQFVFNLRMEAAGQLNLCAQAQSAEGLAVTDCVATTVIDAEAPATSPPVTLPPETRPPLISPPPATPDSQPQDVTPPAAAPPATAPEARPQLQVQVEAPETAEAGEEVQFVVRITNTGDAPAREILIRSDFDAGLVHRSGESPIGYDLARIAPGETKTGVLIFRIEEAGRLCNRVEVTAADDVRASGSACVTAVAPQPPAEKTAPPREKTPPAGASLDVSVTGPAQRRVGEDALFELTVRNEGGVPLTNVRVVSTYDPALRIREADPGFEPDRYEDELVYVLKDLPAGESRRMRVKCECAAPADSACARVTVTSDQTQPKAATACVAIAPSPDGGQVHPKVKPQPPEAKVQPKPVPSKLKLTITDLTDPVKVGGETILKVFVTNEGTVSDKNLALRVTLPPELTVRETEVRLGDVPRVASRLEENAVVFDPVAELRPGRSVTYTIRARADRAGRVSTSARLTSDGLAQPLLTSETTEIER